MPLTPVPRPPQPSRVAAILGRRGDPRAAGQAGAGGSAGPVDPDVLDVRLRRARRPGLVTVPEQLRLGRLAVSTSAVVALVALVLAVGCAFVIRILWAERSAVPQAAAGRPVAAADAGVTVTGPAREPAPSAGGAPSAVPGPSRATGGHAAATEGAAGPNVVVHVVGQVKKPGLVRLGAGARVADALAAAGGATKGADLAALNLARPLSDGEQVYVPKPGEAAPAAGSGSGSGSDGPGVAGSGGGGASGSGAGKGGDGGSGRVSLNTADLDALDSLPGVGPVLAQRILDWRAEHGRFSSVEELGEVSGIGDKLLAQLKPKVTL